MKEIVDKLRELKKTISTMESCTGGALANEITNIPGASEVIKFGAVTYSNEFKIKMGVSEKVINKYTVYSMETAIEMSKSISDFTNSNYGVGITGQLYRYDPANNVDENNKVYISVYDKNNNQFTNEVIEVENVDRVTNKQLVLRKTTKLIKEVINK